VNADTGDWLTVRDGYDRWAPFYDDADPTTLLDEPFVSSFCRSIKGDRILDLGCGTGRYLRKLHRIGAFVVGLDVSAAMLRRARLHTDGTALIQASVTCLPFRPASFNLVLSGLVVDHVVSLDRFFEGVAYVLAPRGRTIITAVHPDMQRLTGPTVRFTAGEDECRIDGVIHEVKDIIEAAENAGFAPIAQEEPCVDQSLISIRPQWRSRLGCRALLLLALERREANRVDSGSSEAEYGAGNGI
jgi:ubiquinone/menaquinone biosynthesis C-methylase UbiE